MKSTFVLGIIFIGVFVVSTVFGVIQDFNTYQFFTHAELDTGTITDTQTDSDGRRVEFCPIIDFKTKSGEPESYEGAHCQPHPDDIQIGQTVQVYFNPAQPDKFITKDDSVFQQYLDQSSGILFGLLFLAIAAIMLAVSLPALFAKRSPSITRASIAQRQAETRQAFGQPSPETEASLRAEQQALAAQSERLKAREEELQRKLDEHRRQQGQ